jgi:adenylate cyclase
VWEVAERVVTTRDAVALPHLLEVAMIAGASGNLGGCTTVMTRVAEASRAAGDHETAAAFVDMALAASADTNQPWWDANLHRMRAELLIDEAERHADVVLDDELVQRAETEWLRALELAAHRRYPVHGLRAAVGYAALLQRLGRVDEACQLLQDRYRRCPEGSTTPVMLTAKAALDDLHELVRHHHA